MNTTDTTTAAPTAEEITMLAEHQALLDMLVKMDLTGDGEPIFPELQDA